MRFLDPEEDANSRSLFADVPAKLEPMIGRKLPLWQVEAAAIGGIILVMLLILGCVLLAGRKKTTAVPALPGSAAGEEEGDVTVDQKLSKLKKQKTKMLMHQVIEKQKLERILRDILSLEAERNNEAMADPEVVKAKAEDAIKAADISMSRNMTTAVVPEPSENLPDPTEKPRRD
ncbi:unnamed protein product [Effrenium voratum]|nr:unnamed protein product [Effrenium voratum]